MEPVQGRFWRCVEDGDRRGRACGRLREGREGELQRENEKPHGVHAWGRAARVRPDANERYIAIPPSTWSVCPVM